MGTEPEPASIHPDVDSHLQFTWKVTHAHCSAVVNIRVEVTPVGSTLLLTCALLDAHIITTTGNQPRGLKVTWSGRGRSCRRGSAHSPRGARAGRLHYDPLGGARGRRAGRRFKLVWRITTLINLFYMRQVISTHYHPRRHNFIYKQADQSFCLPVCRVRVELAWGRDMNVLPRAGGAPPPPIDHHYDQLHRIPVNSTRTNRK